MFFVGWRTVRVGNAPLLGTGIGTWVVAMTTTDDELELAVSMGITAVVVLAAIELVMTELELASDVGWALMDSDWVDPEEDVGLLMTSLEMPNWVEYWNDPVPSGFKTMRRRP